jgi:hypothetical protein
MAAASKKTAAKKGSTARKTGDAGNRRAPNRGSTSDEVPAGVRDTGPENEDVVGSVYDEDEGKPESQKIATAARGLRLSNAARNQRAQQEKFSKATGKLVVVETHSSTRAELADADKQIVKAVGEGFYNLKRRRIGEVFTMYTRGKGDLPAWVIPIEDAEKGQDEGTRGLHSGGREDDRIREERGVPSNTGDRGAGSTGEKVQKSKARFPGVPNIVDPTIVDDSLPLGEGGNERRPRQGGGRGASVL